MKIVKETDVLSGKNPFAYQEIVKNIEYTSAYDSFWVQIIFVKYPDGGKGSSDQSPVISVKRSKEQGRRRMLNMDFEYRIVKRKGIKNFRQDEQDCCRPEVRRGGQQAIVYAYNPPQSGCGFRAALPEQPDKTSC